MDPATAINWPANGPGKLRTCDFVMGLFGRRREGRGLLVDRASVEALITSSKVTRSHFAIGFSPRLSKFASNGRTTSFLCSINTVHGNCTRARTVVPQLSLDRSRIPKVSKKKTPRSNRYSLRYDSIEPKGIYYFGKGNISIRIRVLETGRKKVVGGRNERDPLFSPVGGGCSSSSSSFPRQSEPKRGRDLWESG